MDAGVHRTSKLKLTPCGGHEDVGDLEMVPDEPSVIYNKPLRIKTVIIQSLFLHSLIPETVASASELAGTGLDTKYSFPRGAKGPLQSTGHRSGKELPLKGRRQRSYSNSACGSREARKVTPLRPQSHTEVAILVPT